MTVKKKKIKAAKAENKVKVPVLKNYMEDIARRNAEEQMETRKDVCKCDRCRMDVLAYSLNHLPPKYVATYKGHIYTKLQEMEVQFNADVTREVFKAIEFIKSHKSHE
jgi:competence protein ComFB